MSSLQSLFMESSGRYRKFVPVYVNGKNLIDFGKQNQAPERNSSASFVYSLSRVTLASFFTNPLITFNIIV